MYFVRLNKFNMVKKEVENFGQQSTSWTVRAADYSIQSKFCRILMMFEHIALISLNESKEKIDQVISAVLS